MIKFVLAEALERALFKAVLDSNKHGIAFILVTSKITVDTCLFTEFSRRGVNFLWIVRLLYTNIYP